MKRITSDMLHGACGVQREIFCKEWPDGAPVTLRAAEKAIKLGLDVDWLAVLLTPPLWAEYERQEAPLWAEYERQQAPLWAEYERQQAPLWAEYERQEARVLVSLLQQMPERQERGRKA